VMAGAAAGSLGGMLVDLNIAGVNDEFLDDVGKELSPGKYAVVAEVEEGWTLPVDTKMEALGGVVYRSKRTFSSGCIRVRNPFDLALPRGAKWRVLKPGS